jgi:tetrapyrrole methylase family protein / MazG family protein
LEGPADVEVRVETGEAFEGLYDIICTLRSPDGCPWDREQTPATLRSALLEEAYECIEAIDDRDAAHTKEELGDLFLLVCMISYMHEQEGAFTVAEVLREIGSKLVRRHPHVFSDAKAASSEEVLAQWDRIKTDIEGRNKDKAALSGIPKSLPPLERAYKIQKRVAKVGFDWVHERDVVAKVEEELGEVQEHLQGKGPGLAEELGDLLFSVVNLCRFVGMDPALVLHQTNEKFSRRFGAVEDGMRNRGVAMSAETMAAMDELWEAAKASGRPQED